ncbi:MAG: hypothetical protein RLZZ502_997 [Pseudomonadota bacterium]|jgi:ferredoxin--NADP+ reductase
MPAPAQWTNATIVGRTDWTSDLFSLQFAAPDLATFNAGQFVRLGLDIAGERVGRAFSLVNAPAQPPHEIIAVRVAQGLFSPALHALQIGDSLQVMSAPAGFFTLDECPAANTLWLIATGTGIGPYLSMLRAPATWQKYRQIILVHGTRTTSEQCYLPLLRTLSAQHPLRLVHLCSQEADKMRLTEALSQGLLEARAGAEINTDCHLLLCGNPGMISEMQQLLALRGLSKHRRRAPGQVTTEGYWT